MQENKTCRIHHTKGKKVWWIMQIEWKRRLQIAGIVIGVYLGFRYVLPVMIPFLFGWFLAAVFYGPAQKVEKNFHIRKTVVGSFMILLSVAAVLLLMGIGMKEGLIQLQRLFSNYEQMQEQGMRLLDRCCGFLEEHTGILKEDSRSFLVSSAAQIREDLRSGIGMETVGKATDCVKGLMGIISGLVVAVISGIFILRDMDKLKSKAREYSMLRGCRRVLRRLKETAAVYFKAQILIMLTISIECTVGFWLLKSPYYLLLGLALGLLDALPLIGTGLFLYPAAAVCLFLGRPLLAVGCVLLELLTSFTRELLEPRLLGKKLGIYPVVVLAAVYLGLVLYGAAGVILGPLSFFLMYEIGKEWDVWD